LARDQGPHAFRCRIPNLRSARVHNASHLASRAYILTGMDSLSHLRAALHRALEHPEIYEEADILEELNLNRDILARLFDVGGKNSTERRELESGAC
jgi:hypothetical protein